MSERPLPAVKALIEKSGKILVLKTKDSGEVYWVLPGGKIEYGEEPREALEREIMEELSCDAEIHDPVGMYHFFTGSENSGKQIVLTVFEAEIDNQDIDISENPADEKITEYRWLEPEELIEKSSNRSLHDLVRKFSEEKI